MLHRLGFRFGLHGKSLPGKPDIVLTRHNKVVFVHGCLWHRHGICRALSIPKSNPKKWATKFADNVRRDAEKLAALREAGWEVLVVWECELRDREKLDRQLRAFMTKRKKTVR
jgi:DNA mismatch endonuclease, patch repair protein